MKQPLGRRKKIIENVKPALVLQDEAFLEENPWTGCIENNSKDTAYIIYTSGSSGEPKGVEMSHVAAMNTIEEILHMWNIGAEDSVLNISAFDFDLSVFDIFGLLTVGGTIVLIDEDDFRDPEVWKNLIEIYGITIWNSAPALLDMFLIMGENNHFGKLRLALVSGDWIPLYLPEKWYKVTSANSQFVALGGATEGGIWSNYYCVSKVRELSKVSEEKELLMPIVFTGVLKTDGTVGTIEYGFSHTPQVWIDCQIVDEIDSEDQEKGLMISWDTRKGAIKESIVTEMFESFTETIRILGIKHSEEWKNPLEIIVPSASKKKVICERNKGITNQSRIQQRFVKYAKKNSNKTAVIDAVETVTYGELLERAEYIAGYLRKEFVENRTGLVAIRMKKSVNQIAAVMGVLIAGFSYLPIDIKQPLARQEKILSKANVIVELDEKKVNMILQNLEYRLEKHPEFQNPIAYVIFTSGSTGEPKGVVMSHTAAQNTLIAIENMYNISEEDTILGIAESIKKIVCSISGNDYIDYEDNLLENGLDSLLLSQISGRIVSDIQEAQGMRFDEILRASLTMPTIMGIAQYISDCKNPSKNQMHSNAGNQTRNSYTVVYIFGDNENEIRDVLIEKLSASNISCKRVGGQEIIERCHEDISVKKKYIIAFSEMASLCITKASELLGENIIINRIFLINPSKAKESDLYLGDISIIDGNSVAIKSWEKAVLGNVREFESNSNDIFDIIMRELENDK